MSFRLRYLAHFSNVQLCLTYDALARLEIRPERSGMNQVEMKVRETSTLCIVAETRRTARKVRYNYIQVRSGSGKWAATERGEKETRCDILSVTSRASQRHQLPSRALHRNRNYDYGSVKYAPYRIVTVFFPLITARKLRTVTVKNRKIRPYTASYGVYRNL